MALVAPMLFLLLFGIVEFGLVLNDVSSMRQGVRDAARQGAVLNFGSDSTCGATTLTGAPTADMIKLICLTKNQIGVGDQVHIKIKFKDGALSADSPNFVAGNGLVICAASPIKSKTGMFTPFLTGRNLTAKNVFRIEQDPATAETGGQETDPTGQNWSWCDF